MQSSIPRLYFITFSWNCQLFFRSGVDNFYQSTSWIPINYIPSFPIPGRGGGWLFFWGKECSRDGGEFHLSALPPLRPAVLRKGLMRLKFLKYVAANYEPRRTLKNRKIRPSRSERKRNNIGKSKTSGTPFDSQKKINHCRISETDYDRTAWYLISWNLNKDWLMLKNS